MAKEKEKTEKQICIKEVKASGSFEHTGARRGIRKTAPAQGGTIAMAKTSAPSRGVKAVPGVARLPSEIQRHV